MKYSGACLWREARAKQAPPAANSHSLGAFCVLMREWHLRASATRPPPTAANVINSDDGATTNFQHGAAKAFNPFATRKSRGMQPCATPESSRLPTFGADGKWARGANRKSKQTAARSRPSSG